MITVVTATGLEFQAVRRAVPPGVRVLCAGIALKALREPLAGLAISCGVAGGLREDLPTGTVVIPRAIGRPDGSQRSCDPAVTDALIDSARALGTVAVESPIFTADSLLGGAQRERWSERGYSAVDMETGRIESERIACVRVILDTPQHEISAAWERPVMVFVHPDAWKDLPFLVREGPRCAALAAAILGRALRSSSIQ